MFSLQRPSIFPVVQNGAKPRRIFRSVQISLQSTRIRYRSLIDHVMEAAPTQHSPIQRSMTCGECLVEGMGATRIQSLEKALRSRSSRHFSSAMSSTLQRCNCEWSDGRRNAMHRDLLKASSGTRPTGLSAVKSEAARFLTFCRPLVRGIPGASRHCTPIEPVKQFPDSPIASFKSVSRCHTA